MPADPQTKGGSEKAIKIIKVDPKPPEATRSRDSAELMHGDPDW